MLQEDMCGVCGGDGIAEGACDCDGNGPDEECGVCGGCMGSQTGDVLTNSSNVDVRIQSAVYAEERRHP